MRIASVCGRCDAARRCYVMDISKVVARVNVPQNQAVTVKIGQPATITQVDTDVKVRGKVAW